MGTVVSAGILAQGENGNAAVLVWDFFVVGDLTLPEQQRQDEFLLEGAVVEGFFFGAPPGKKYVVLG